MSLAQAEKKIRLKNVMYATDFSHAADVAFPYTAEFARRFSAKFYAVHVRIPEEYLLAPAKSQTAVDADFEKEEAALQVVLRNDLPHLKYRGLVPRRSCLACARICNPRQTDRSSGSRYARQGRLEETPVGFGGRRSCAVCAVSCTDRRPRAPSEPTFEGQVSEILYATDLSEASAAAAPYVMTVAREHGAGLTVLHVIRKFPANVPVRPDEIEAAVMQQVEDVIGRKGEKGRMGYAVKEGDPADTILEVAETEKADLIVLGLEKTRRTCERSFASSVCDYTSSDCARQTSRSQHQGVDSTGRLFCSALTMLRRRRRQAFMVAGFRAKKGLCIATKRQ